MLERNAEFLLKSGLEASNQVQIDAHLSVKSCFPTQYANIFECTAEASNFTIEEVCSFIGVFDFFFVWVLLKPVSRLFVLGEVIICGFLFIQFYRGRLKCSQNDTARWHIWS